MFFKKNTLTLMYDKDFNILNTACQVGQVNENHVTVTMTEYTHEQLALCHEMSTKVDTVMNQELVTLIFTFKDNSRVKLRVFPTKN